MENIMKFIFLFISFLLLQTVLVKPSYAAKVKSASAYLKRVETSANRVVENLNSLKKLMNSSTDTGSFITSDFWGTTPRWYLDGYSGGTTMVTSHYPFDSSIFWQKWLSKDTYVRNIKNISLTPKGSESWSASFMLNLDDFYSNDTGNLYANFDRLSNYFDKNGVPKKQNGPAIKFYSKQHDAMTEILLPSVLRTFNGLFEKVMFADYDISSHGKAFTRIFGESLGIPKDHKAIVDEAVESLSQGSWTEAIQCEKKSQLEGCFTLNSGVMSLNVKAVSHHFQVASGMKKSLRYSQLTDLEDLLAAKLEAGKAVLETLGTVSRYRDAEPAGKYQGSIDIDLKSGKGAWRTPIWAAKDDMAGIEEQFNINFKQLRADIKKYLDAALSEAIRKYSNNTKRSDNDSSDF